MKNFSIVALSIICCTQSIQSMELEKTSSEDKGYPIIIKDTEDYPKPAPISNKFNALSEELYREGITSTEIIGLVAYGAEVNYKKKGDWPVVFVYADQNRVDNMRTVIELGAAIHNIQYETHTPLTIVLQNDHSSFEENKDLSKMIQFLITYENPMVTIYKHEKFDKDGSRPGDIDIEQRIREWLIRHSFAHPNITTIKMLIERKLMTANRGLEQFYYHQKPNQEVLDLLLAYKADNANALLPKLVDNTFTSEQCMQFLRQACESGAYDRDARNKLLRIKENIDAIVVALNKTYNETDYPIIF